MKFSRTIRLTRWLRVGRVSVALEFKPADLWIGFYVSPDETWRSGTVWVCIVPCLPLHVDWWDR